MNDATSANPLSHHEFRLLGADRIAFIKPVTREGRTVFAVHAANGKRLALLDSYEVACMTVVQNDLEPVSVH